MTYPHHLCLAGAALIREVNILHPWERIGEVYGKVIKAFQIVEYHLVQGNDALASGYSLSAVADQ